MAYLDEDNPSNVGKRVGIFIAIGAAMLAGRFLVPSLMKEVSSASLTPARVSAELESRPEYGELYGAIKANYPDEYEAFVDRITEIARTGDEARGREESFAFTRNLMTDHLDDLGKAPSKDLHDIAGQYRVLVHALQQSDARLCAQFFDTGFQPGTRPPAEVLAQLAHVGAMQVAAAKAGEARPVNPRGTLSDSDGDRFYAALKGRSPSAADLLGDRRAQAAASPEVQCAMGVAIYDTVAGLPDDLSAAVMVAILSDSFGPAAAPGTH